MRIAVLSDDHLFREGLLRILGVEPLFTIVGAVESPDVLLLDSSMERTLEICATSRSPVLFVAAPDDDQWSFRALDAGARGILLKSATTEDMVLAIQFVSEGLIWARRRVMAARIDHLTGVTATALSANIALEQRLSMREREVFRQAATGLGNKQLADRLQISEATVKAHLTSIFLKLGVRGRAELAAAYHGIIPGLRSAISVRLKS